MYVRVGHIIRVRLRIALTSTVVPRYKDVHTTGRGIYTRTSQRGTAQHSKPPNTQHAQHSSSGSMTCIMIMLTPSWRQCAPRLRDGGRQTHRPPDTTNRHQQRCGPASRPLPCQAAPPAPRLMTVPYCAGEIRGGGGGGSERKTCEKEAWGRVPTEQQEQQQHTLQ